MGYVTSVHITLFVIKKQLWERNQRHVKKLKRREKERRG